MTSKKSKATPARAMASAMAPKPSLREEFARNLYRAIQKRGWTQTDLARHTGIGRDSISHYIAGRNMPGPVNAKRIADALNVPLEQIMPWIAMNPITGDTPDMEFKMIGDKAWLSINKLLRADTAVKILAMIREDETGN